MAGATMTNQSAIYKTIWPQEVVEERILKDRPLLASLRKEDDWDGNFQDIVIWWSPVGGRSASFNASRANKAASRKSKMHIPSYDLFESFSVDHKALWLSRNKRGAVVKLLEGETKSAIDKFGRGLAMIAWSNGGGSIGRLSTTTNLATNQIILANLNDARNFEVDDVLAVSSDDGTGGAGVRSGTVTVTAVETTGLNEGRITVDAVLNVAIPAIVAQDFLFIDGDYAAWAPGVPAYVTKTSTPGTIHGMARSGANTHLQRLSGSKVDCSRKRTHEALKFALAKGYRDGCDIRKIFLHSDRFFDLEMSLGSAVRYADVKMGNVGFTGIKVTQPKGPSVEVFQDPDCPINDFYGLNDEDFVLHSAGGTPIWLTASGAKELRVEEANNSVEGRVGAYFAIYPENPGDHLIGGFAGLT